MGNNFEININSLCCKIFINLAYLLLGVIVNLSIVFLIHYFHLLKISSICSIFISIPIVIIIEKYRQNTYFNTSTVHNIYKIFYLLNKEPFKITNFIDKILDVCMFLLFIYYIYKQWDNMLPLNSVDKHPVFSTIGIVITVSSIVLTVLFASLQHFENKYSDFKSILQQWKKTNIFLFIALAVYTTITFIFYFKGSNEYIDLFILVASIYLVLKLIIIAINISFMMNFDILLMLYEKNIIKFIKSWKLSSDKSLIDDIRKKGMKHFFKNKIWGINRRKYYTNSETTIEELKKQIEPIFRQAENFLRANNLNDFLTCKNALINIARIYNKSYKNNLESKIYQFLAYKIKDLFVLSVMLKYQSFPEHIVDLNEKIGICAINERTDENSFYTMQSIGFLSFKKNAQEFVIISINLENTPAPSNAIISLRKFVHKLIFNHSVNEASGIVDDLELLALAIYNLNKTKKLTNEAWSINLISLIIIDFINIFYNIAMYNLTEKLSVDTDYLENKVKEAFVQTFKLLTTYNTYPSAFSIFFNNIGGDLNLKSVTDILNKSPYIKTPYKNSVINGSSLFTHYVNALDQVYNAILVYDFDDNVYFERGFSCINNFLELFESSAKTLFDSNNIISINGILEALNNIQKYIFIFIKRINATNYQKELLLNASSLLLTNLYSIFLNILEKYTNSENLSSLYIEDFVHFVSLAVQTYNNADKLNKEIIKDLIQNIIIYFEKLENKKNLYQGINLITLILSKNDRDSEIFTLLCNFIIKHKPQHKPKQSLYFNYLEENEIPHFARHWIDHSDIHEYSNILSEFQKKKINLKSQLKLGKPILSPHLLLCLALFGCLAGVLLYLSDD